MVTINDVAKQAGVSIGTVSNVINKKGNTSEKTREAVLNAIHELNYIPNTVAQELKTSNVKKIGIVAEDISAFMSGKIIDGISDICEKLQYSVSLVNLRAEYRANANNSFNNFALLDKSKEFHRVIKQNINSLLSSRISGLIYIGIYPRDVSNLLPSLPVPCVYTYCFTIGKDDYTVNYDDYQGAKITVDYLASLGHKKIALISGPIDSIPTHKRMRGYSDSLMNNNLVFNPAYIKVGNWRYEDGYNLCSELLSQSDPPTAIFCMSDVMAYGAIASAIDHGIKVPDQLSIHGFDDLRESEFYIPSLSTVSIPLTSMGNKAASLLIDHLQGNPQSEKKHLIPCVHRPRNSTCQVNSELPQTTL